MSKKSQSQKALSLVNPVNPAETQKNELKGNENTMENTLTGREEIEKINLLTETVSADNLEAIKNIIAAVETPSETPVARSFADVLVSNRAGRATNKTFFNTVEFYKKWKSLVNQIRVNLADYAIQNYNGIDTGNAMPEEVEAVFVNQFFADYKEVLSILSHSVNANLHAKKTDFFALYPFSVKAERSGKGTQRDVKPNGELSFRLSLENFLADRITEAVTMPASMIEAQKAAKKAAKAAKKAVEAEAKKAKANLEAEAKKSQKAEQKRLDDEAKTTAKSEQVASC